MNNSTGRTAPTQATTSTPALPPEKRERLRQLITSATRVFVSQGYRRTTMADIARHMGVAPGTLYLYAESKEALFLLALRYHVGRVDLESPQLQLPVSAPPHDDMVALVRSEAETAIVLPRLQAAIDSPAPIPNSIMSEANAVLSELYDTVARYRRAVKLVEGSAQDWPDLADLFYHGLRQGFVDQLVRYVEHRVAGGCLPPVPSPQVAGRLILEAIGWFAMHRHGDPAAPPVDEETIRATVLLMASRALGISDRP